MDLLARRYASPFVLLNEMIRQNRFREFVVEVNSIVIEEDENAKLWDIWLHKVFDGQSFVSWKKSLQVRSETQQVSKAELEAAVKNSKDILSGFNPTDGG